MPGHTGEGMVRVWARPRTETLVVRRCSCCIGALACTRIGACRHEGVSGSRYVHLQQATCRSTCPALCMTVKPLLHAGCGGVPCGAVVRALRHLPTARQPRRRRGAHTPEHWWLSPVLDVWHSWGSELAPRHACAAADLLFPTALIVLHPCRTQRTVYGLPAAAAAAAAVQVGLVKMAADWVIKHHMPHLAGEGEGTCVCVVCVCGVFCVFVFEGGRAESERKDLWAGGIGAFGAVRVPPWASRERVFGRAYSPCCRTACKQKRVFGLAAGPPAKVEERPPHRLASGPSHHGITPSTHFHSAPQTPA